MYEYGLNAELKLAAEQAAADFEGYLRELTVARRSTPGADLITDLLAVQDEDGSKLSEDELVATCALLLMAGHEASVNLVGNGVTALLRNRDQWEKLVAQPKLAPSAVEEIIRFDSPLQLFERTAIADTTVAGVEVGAGAKIAALLGAAAHDQEVFDSPEKLDIERSPNNHLGFGVGIHFCLGAPLARIEAAAVLTALATQVPTLELAGLGRRRAEFVIRGYENVPVNVR
jgi:cytochrome P450